MNSARTIKQLKRLSAILVASILAVSVCTGSLVNAEDPPPTTSSAVTKPVFRFSRTSIVSTQGLSVSSYAISSTGGVVESFSVSPELPTGVSLNTLTGLLEGTPVDVSTASVYTVTATNAGGSSSKSFRFSVRIPPPAFSISTAEVVAIVDVPVTSYEVVSSGGPIDSFKIFPALPKGIDFDSSTGTISGVLSVEKAQRTYKITATNSSGRSFQLLNFKVANSSQQIQLSSDNESVTLGSVMIGFTASSTGGIGARYQISPSEPPGTKFSTSTGTLTGRPVNLQEATVYTVTATNSGGSSTQTFTLTVTLAGPVFVLSRSSESVVADSVMTGFTASSSGGAVASYAISPDAPAGTSFNTSTGVLSGRPTTVKTATV